MGVHCHGQCIEALQLKQGNKISNVGILLFFYFGGIVSFALFYMLSRPSDVQEENGKNENVRGGERVEKDRENGVVINVPLEKYPNLTEVLRAVQGNVFGVLKWCKRFGTKQ